MQNNYDTYFSKMPQVNISRTKMRRKKDHKTTFNAGVLVPILKLPVLPGDTNKLKTSVAIRMSTPIKPIMDNIFLDIFFFWVPNRLSYENFKYFMGENPANEWDVDLPEYQIPSIILKSLAKKGTIADYFGVPQDIFQSGSYGLSVPLKISHIPYRDYCLIWNRWFRSEATQKPIFVPRGDSSNQFIYDFSMLSNYNPDETLDPDLGYFRTAISGGTPAPVCKIADYFTSSLPEPQYGEDVAIPFGEFIPVVSRIDVHGGHQIPPKWTSDLAGNEPVPANVYFKSDTVGGGRTVYTSSTTSSSNDSAYLANLWAQTEGLVASVNDLRQALAVQRYLESDARYGTRYQETLRAHFGVSSSNAVLQDPELLSARRVTLNVQQVLQTSSTDETSPQGNTSAFSYTLDVDESFNKSFTEHGYIIGLCCVRTSQSYQYGISRDDFALDKFDFYSPEFAHLGEMPVYNKEIYVQGNSDDDEVFGYQEAYAWERYLNNQISGSFASRAPGSLDFWHLAQEYDSLPTLSEAFMIQSREPIDRALAVTSELEHQFIAEFYFDIESVRPMPLYSIPGLSSHF